MAKLKNGSAKERILQRVHKQRLKSIRVLPSLITLLNGLFGFTAIIFASKAAFAQAGYMLFLAMIADVLDGRVARMSQSTSSFGGQLDSLCDIISFGVAPAFLMLKILEYKLGFAELGVFFEGFFQRFIWLAAAAYLSCTAIRLARFNVENEEDESAHMSFIGLPSPAAAGVIASMVIFHHEILPELAAKDGLVYLVCENIIVYSLPFITLGIAVLMISRIRYPHVLNQYMKGKKPLAHLMTCLLVLGLIIWFRQIAMMLGFCGFAAWGVTKWFLSSLTREKNKPALSSAPETIIAADTATQNQ